MPSYITPDIPAFLLTDYLISMAQLLIAYI